MLREMRCRLGDLLAAPALPARMLSFIALLACPLALHLPMRTVAAAEVRVPPGRVELAPVPEIAFVAGVPETVQLGAFVLDPANRWTPGDLTRASGWKSRFPLTLTGPGEGFAFDAQTGELRYTGGRAGDIAARLKVANAVREFRIRVLTPTHVYGDDAAAMNQAHKWGATICATPMTFTACRKKFKGAGTDAAPLVLFITSGSYSKQDFFLGSRRFLYVLGDAGNRPLLSGDELGSTKFERFTVANLVLEDTNLNQGHASPQWPSWFNISRVRQYGETRVQNGIFNPTGLTHHPWTIDLWSIESQGMGNAGNTTHSLYLEGRPDSHLSIINSRFLGSRGSSAVKTTMQDVQIRHSLFSVSEKPGDVSSGLLMHTPVDVTGG